MAGKEHVVSTEKSHLGISVVREAGERSSCVTKKAQTDGTIPIIPTTREARLEIVREAKESVMNQSRTPTPKIQKVIFFLRDHKDFQKYYKPRVVSIGPIHHGNKKYQQGDDYKRRLTSEFVNCSGETREHLHEKIEEKIKELRDCFDEEVTKDYDDEALAELLFLDGCAILQYIYLKTYFVHPFLDSNISVDLGQDLFLLENQVPYCLLKCLSNNEKKLKGSIYKFFQMHVMVPEDSLRIFRDEEPIHLLDLLRTSLLGKPHANSVIKREQHWQSCRNLQDLKAAGICLKRSSNSCLHNISFSRRFHWLGHLYLPPIHVDYSMKHNFLNLIAYEMCPDFESDLGVTSYICFLHSLIDEVQDVQELRKAGIFCNLFGSDEEVAQLFNEIGTDLVYNAETYKWVQVEIQNHYDRFRFYNDHLGDIWLIAVYLAALLYLTLQYWMFRFYNVHLRDTSENTIFLLAVLGLVLTRLHRASKKQS